LALEVVVLEALVEELGRNLAKLPAGAPPK